jgi:lipopolysaccharide transport system permease protein
VRNVQVRYAQTILGVWWAMLQPLIMMVVFTLIFGRFAGVPSDDRPYQVFAFSALVPWTYFASVLNNASGSLGSNPSLITKIYFPRLAMPLSYIVAGLVDFAIGMALLLLMLRWYGLTPAVLSVAVIPLLLLVMMLTALGIGSWLAALNVKYRDVRHAIPFVLQIAMYASPIVYPMSVIPEPYRWVYMLNPMTGVIEGFRAVLLRTGAVDWQAIGVSLLVASLVCLTGVSYFRQKERMFADVV